MQAVTGAPLGSRGFLLASIGPRRVGANRVDRYYGVRESEATPDRPAYTGTSGWNWDFTLGATAQVAGRWSVFVLFSREAFGDVCSGAGLNRPPCSIMGSGDAARRAG